MARMQITELKEIDLNLLVLLDQILEQGNLSRAAEKLELSQPASSRMLRQLRAQLGDPILISAGRRSVASARVEELRAPLRAWLRQAQHLLQTPTLDLERAGGTFRVHLLDHLALLLLPAFMLRLETRAPRVEVQLIANVADPLEELRSGRLDLVVGEIGPVAEDFRAAQLFQDGFVCVVRRGHPALRAPFTAETFARERHILFNSGGVNVRCVDSLLHTRGLTRSIALRSPHIYLACAAVSATDLVLSLPRRAAEHLAELYPLQVTELPFELETLSVLQVWHGRLDTDPLQRWLRAQLAEVAVALEPGAHARNR